MKFALIALIAVASGIKISKIGTPDTRAVVTPGESVVEVDFANLPEAGTGPDPAYSRITDGPRYS